MSPVLWQELEGRGVPVGTLLKVGPLLRGLDKESTAALVIAVVEKFGSRPYKVGDTLPL